jgi:hypothetical protein
VQYYCLPLHLAALQYLHLPENIFENPNKFSRVRPGDPLWPSPEKWEQLNKAVNGNLGKD